MNTYLELFLTFLKINLLSTSGPASVGLIYSETVEHLHMITDAQYVQAVGFASVLPGSDALQMAMYIGYNAAGIIGGFVALLASILPPTLIILAVVSLLHRIRREAWVTSFIEGLTPAIVMVILFAAWKIFQKGGETGWQGWLLGGAALVALLFEVPERLVILVAAVLGVLLFS
jgi:chromate transporter